MITAPTFEIAVYCLNCGHEWTADVAFRTEVIQVAGQGVWLQPGDCARAGRYVECPNCGLVHEVKRRWSKER